MLTFKPLTAEIWSDLKCLFGEKGACGGCWCMYWRCSHKEYELNKGYKNKSALLNLIKHNTHLGVLAFFDDKPIGWCSISPKTELVRFKTSRLFKSITSNSTWCISCLFIHKKHRNRGISAEIIHAATAYAFENGASIIEAYPIIPKTTKSPPAFAWVGFVNSFLKSGFVKKEQVSDNRMIMEYKKPLKTKIEY